MSERSVIAEFHLREDDVLELFSLTTQEGSGYRKHYDVDFCKRDQSYCYHMSGAGPANVSSVSTIYWTAEGVEVKEEPCLFVDEARRERNRTRRISEIPAEFGGMDLLQWLGTNACETDTVYCSECDDQIPCESLCGHVWFCVTVGDYSTPIERLEFCSDKECDCLLHI